MSSLLAVSGLSAGVEEKTILHGVDLEVEKGKCYILMGPNGAGKSTLGRVIMGDPQYEVTGGSVVFDGEDVTELSPDKRSMAGMFLSYQAPVDIPGVPMYSFLRTICQKRPGLKMTSRQFRQRVNEVCEQLNMDTSYLTRDLNVGFSGGEKKKVEMLQLLLLQPKLAILDETDSGLDVDALSVVSRGIEAYRKACDGALIIITHNTRILERVEVDEVKIMVKGHMVATGPASLIQEIDQSGFGAYEQMAAGNAEDTATDAADAVSAGAEDGSAAGAADSTASGSSDLSGEH